jgi:hypothetical protein
MKVICIGEFDATGHAMPAIGDIVTVIDECKRLEAWQADRLTQEDKMLQALAECMPEAEMPQNVFDRVWENIKAAL